MSLYEVVSPEYLEFGGSDTQPPEYGRDYLKVEANSARVAIVLAVNSLDFRGWCREARSNDTTPFNGVVAYLVEEDS